MDFLKEAREILNERPEWQDREIDIFLKDLQRAGGAKPKQVADEINDGGVGMLKNAVENLIDGNYGQGAYIKLKEQTKRSNRNAWVVNVVMSLEFDVKQGQASKVWGYLNPEVQKEVNDFTTSKIKEFDREQD